MCGPQLGMAGAGMGAQLAGNMITEGANKRAYKKQAAYMTDQRAQREQQMADQQKFLTGARTEQQGYTGKQTELQGQANANLSKTIDTFTRPNQDAATAMASQKANDYIQNLIKPAIVNTFGAGSASPGVHAAAGAAAQKGQDLARSNIVNLSAVQGLKDMIQTNSQAVNNNATDLGVLKNFAAGDDQMKNAITREAAISNNAFNNRLSGDDALRDTVVDSMKFKGSPIGDVFNGLGDLSFQQGLLYPTTKPAFPIGKVPVPVMKPAVPSY